MPVSTGRYALAVESWGADSDNRSQGSTSSGEPVGWLPLRKKGRAGTLRTATSDDADHLAQFVKSRTGVEAYIEPRTAVTEVTVVLVANTGEWTRRRIDGAEGARSFTKKYAIPLYDAAVVGYPKRMREWTERRKQSGDDGPPGAGPLR
jgi:hypothetical protein